MNYFLVLTSIIVHGVTIPLGKGFHRIHTQTLTASRTMQSINQTSRIPTPISNSGATIQRRRPVDTDDTSSESSRTCNIEQDGSTGDLADGLSSRNTPARDMVRFREPDTIAQHSELQGELPLELGPKAGEDTAQREGDDKLLKPDAQMTCVRRRSN